MQHSKLELQQMTDRFLRARNRDIITGNRNPSKLKWNRLKKMKARKKGRT